VPKLFWDHGRALEIWIGVFLTMHLWRENTRMQIRWATGSLLRPLDDFFGFFLVWRLEGNMVKWMSVFWDVCVHDIGALIFWVLPNIYSQQNWSTPKAWQTDQVFASCYPFSSPYLGIDSVCISALFLTLAQSSTDFCVPNICQIHWIQHW
jgi:hypothetical protein